MSFIIIIIVCVHIGIWGRRCDSGGRNGGKLVVAVMPVVAGAEVSAVAARSG
jgi:hypothetical protein